VESFQKQDDSNMSIGDSRSDSVYEGSNVGVSSDLYMYVG